MDMVDMDTVDMDTVDMGMDMVDISKSRTFLDPFDLVCVPLIGLERCSLPPVIPPLYYCTIDTPIVP